MKDKYQILKRQLKAEEYDEVKRGIKSFDVLLRVPGQQMDVGDLLTLQETDAEGELTGNEVTKKISSRLDVEELEVPDYVDLGKALKNGVSVIGWVAPEQYTLKSVYDFAFTMHLAIDRIEEDDIADEQEGTNYNIVEGPYYSPPLASPEFLQYGILDGFKIEKWPIGRYSIVLMVHVDVPEEEKPIEMDAVDAMVMTVQKAELENVDEGFPTVSLQFHELDVRALTDGNTVSLENKKITPATPKEIEAVIEEQKEREQQMYAPDLAPDMSEKGIMEALRKAKEAGELGDMDDDEMREMMADIIADSKDALVADNEGPLDGVVDVGEEQINE